MGRTVGVSRSGNNPETADPYGAAMDVRLVRWPAARAQLDELRAAGVPRLVVVDGDVAPPFPPDELEDWVRLPADQSDVRVRVDTLAERARGKAIPQLSNEGVLRHAGASVALSPVESRLVRALVVLPAKFFPKGAAGGKLVVPGHVMKPK